MFEKINEVNNFWGDTMPMMAMEEAGELIQAISKYERKKDDISRQNLIDEIGDMVISMTCICIRDGISKEDVLKRINEKLNKKY